MTNVYLGLEHEAKAREHLRKNLHTDLSTAEETGFRENFGEALHLERRENITTSEYDAEAPYREREEYIEQLLRDGELDERELRKFLVPKPGTRAISDAERDEWLDRAEEEASPYNQAHAYLNLLGHPVDNMQYDYRRLAKHLQDSGFDVNTDEELQASITENLATRRAEAQNVFGRASGIGKAAQFLGAVGGQFSDPLNLATVAIPGGQIKAGAKLGVTIGRVAAQEAAINVGVEAAVIASQDDFRKKYNLMPANIPKQLAVGAAAGAVLGAAGGALAYKFQPRVPDDALPQRAAVEEHRAVVRETDEFAEESPLAADGHPAPDQQQMMDEAYAAEEGEVRQLHEVDDVSITAEVTKTSERLEWLRKFQDCLKGGVDA